MSTQVNPVIDFIRRTFEALEVRRVQRDFERFWKILFKIIAAPGVQERLQAPFLPIKNQIQVQGAPGAAAVNRLGDFLRRHRNPPVVQDPGQRRRSALIHLLGKERNLGHKFLRSRVFERGNRRAGSQED